MLEIVRCCLACSLSIVVLYRRYSRSLSVVTFGRRYQQAIALLYTRDYLLVSSHAIVR